MKRYNWSLSLGQYLQRYIPHLGFGLPGLGVVVYQLHSRYGVGYEYLVPSIFLFLLIILAHRIQVYRRYIENAFFEINGDIITWHFGGEDHTYDISSLLDFEVPPKKYSGSSDYLNLYFDNESSIEIDSSFPDFDILKKELLDKIVHHDQLQFLLGKFRGVHA